MKRSLTALSLLLVFAVAAGPSSAQAPSEWHDALLDHLAGSWKMEGKVVGRDAHHDLEAEWILNHQFLRLHERTSASASATEKRYDALWFIGWDEVSDRYVVHLLDVFGARYSETLGYGTRDGNAIRLVFEYPDGPFHTTYTWSPESNTWLWHLEQKDKNGKWTTFADLTLTRSGRP